jgi:hypothetical protein
MASNEHWDKWAHWEKTRHKEEEYNRRVANIERDGITCTLQWQETVHEGYDTRNPFFSLRVTFPPRFQHLIVPEAQREKEATKESYHISIGNKFNFYDNDRMYRRLDTVFRRFRHPVTHHFANVRVTSGSTYELKEPDAIVWEIKDVVKHGTGKNEPHISLD